MEVQRINLVHKNQLQMTCFSSRCENGCKIIPLLYFHCAKPCDYYHVTASLTLPLAYPLPIFRETDRGRSSPDPARADGYVRYARLGLWRCLVVNIMTCVGSYVNVYMHTCVCLPFYHSPLFQLPWIYLGKDHFATTKSHSNDKLSNNLCF